MIGLIIGMIITVALSLIACRNYLGYGVYRAPGPIFRRGYLVFSVFFAAIVGTVIGGIVDLVIWLFHL